MRILNTTNLLLSGYYWPMIWYVQDGEMSSSDKTWGIAITIVEFVFFGIIIKMLSGNVKERNTTKESIPTVVIIAGMALVILALLLKQHILG